METEKEKKLLESRKPDGTIVKQQQQQQQLMMTMMKFSKLLTKPFE